MFLLAYIEPTSESKELVTGTDIRYQKSNDVLVDLNDNSNINLGESMHYDQMIVDWKSDANKKPTLYDSDSNRVFASGGKSGSDPVGGSKNDDIVSDDKHKNNLNVMGYGTRTKQNNYPNRRRSRQIYRGDYKRTTPAPGRTGQGTRYKAKQEYAMNTVQQKGKTCFSSSFEFLSFYRF